MPCVEADLRQQPGSGNRVIHQRGLIVRFRRSQRRIILFGQLIQVKQSRALSPPLGGQHDE